MRSNLILPRPLKGPTTYVSRREPSGVPVQLVPLQRVAHRVEAHRQQAAQRADVRRVKHLGISNAAPAHRMSAALPQTDGSATVIISWFKAGIVAPRLN